MEAARWAREKARCEDDFLYLAQTYLRIKSKRVIGFPTLKLNRVQRLLHDKVERQRRAKGWVRQVWGKARQVGASTYCRGRSFHETGFKDDRNAFLCTHDEPTSYEMFDLDKTFWDALPKPLQPSKKYDAKSRIVFGARNSKVVVGHARNMNVGASQMNHFVHLTEVARYPNPEQIQASLFPSISDAKGDDCSMVFIESTSIYGGDWFKEFAEAAQRGENEYEFTFIPWYYHEDYTVPVPRGFRLTDEERDLKRRFNLTDGQMAWRRSKQAEYRTNPALFVQEFPMTWEESFILPRGTFRVFPDDVIAQYRHQLRPGKRMQPTSTGLEAQLGGMVEVWEEPTPDIFYDLGVDVSQGATAEADWTVAEVIRRDTLEQVAEFRAHIDPSSPEFTNLIYWLGMAYNTAQINPDITGGWGMALLSDLQRRSYPNIWRWRRRDDAKERVSTRLGFLYTERDKTALVSNAVQLARVPGQTIVHSETLAGEMVTYLNIGLNEWGAAPGYHDDAVSAWMLALLAARDERNEWRSAEQPEEQAVKPAEYRVHDVMADLHEESTPDLLDDLAPWRV